MEKSKLEKILSILAKDKILQQEVKKILQIIYGGQVRLKINDLD